MYRPPHFDETRLDVLHETIRVHPLGLLIRNGPEGLTADSIPFLVALGGDFGRLEAHVARANPLWKELSDGDEVLVVFQGPQHYVTPGWYATKQETGKVVPTWNYVIVQAHGTITIRDDSAFVGRQIRALTDAHESRRPKPWAVDDAPETFVAQQTRAIVGIEIAITRLIGKWKVSQNRNLADRAGVVAGLAGEADPQASSMAELVEATIAVNSAGSAGS
jgi:transcriptional regulator